MIALRFSAVRPPKLNEDFYRVYVLQAMRESAELAMKEFQRISELWKSNKPNFSYKLSTVADGRTSVTVTIVTDNPFFGYLDQGVEGHLIIPRKASVSGTWGGEYHAGSTPGTLTVEPGGGHKILKGYFNLNQVLDWPGIKARNWSTLIREKVEKERTFSDRIQDALNRSAAKAFRS